MLEDADCCPMASKVFPNQEDLTDLQVTIEDPEGTPICGKPVQHESPARKGLPCLSIQGLLPDQDIPPNVGTKGEICVEVLTTDWTAGPGNQCVLQTIRCPLIALTPRLHTHVEAGRLLRENHEEYPAASRLTEIRGGRRWARGQQG